MGGCEAVHLPLPPGRSHHLPGQVPRLCRLHPGGGGGGAAAHPVPELPLPAGGAGGGQLRIPQRHVRRLRRDGLHRRRGPSIPVRPSRPTAATPWSWTRWTPPPRGEEEKTARDLIEARFAAKRIRALVDGGFPISDGEGGERPVRPADIVILLRSPQHGAPPLRPRPGGAGHPMGGGGRRRLLRRHRGERGPLPAPDRGQPKAGRAPHLRPPLPRCTASPPTGWRSSGPPAPTPTSTPPWPPTGGEDSRAFLAELDELRFGAGELSSHELLWQLYDRTNLLGVFGAMERGGGAAVQPAHPGGAGPPLRGGGPQGPVRLFCPT